MFGDPHYKTFDGKFFNFQGSCKYQLTSDCKNHTFSIRATNDGRDTKSSSWTKTVTLKMGSVKVNLGQKLRIKVNGTRVHPPYKLDGVLDIQRTEEGVSVATHIGIDLLWDGNGFLQVTAATKYKGMLCGLCGNYNNVYRDDLTSRLGNIYADNETAKFANSWKVGGVKACSRRSDVPRRVRPCRHKEGWQHCKRLRDLETFDDCGSHLNPINYYKACRKDMCECPHGKCFCDAFVAYAHECRRVGVSLSDKWKRLTSCDARNATIVPHAVRRRKKKKPRLHVLQPEDPKMDVYLTQLVPQKFQNKDHSVSRPPPPLQ